MLNLKEVDEQLTAILKDHAFDETRLVDTMNRLKNPQQVIFLIQSLLQNDDQVNKCAAISEHHRIGFTKLYLAISPFHQLHLHIFWPSEVDNRKESIHNHKFSFLSAILKGGLINQIYQRCETGGELLHEYLAKPNASQQCDKFEYRALTNIRVIDEQNYHSGQIYSLHHETFHNAIPKNFGELTITLFLRSANQKEADTIFERIPFNDSHQVSLENHKLTVDNYIHYLRQIMQQLN